MNEQSAEPDNYNPEYEAAVNNVIDRSYNLGYADALSNVVECLNVTNASRLPMIQDLIKLFKQETAKRQQRGK